MLQLSIIIPAFNEGTAVGATVKRVQDVFENTGTKIEIIVVDDGSKDATALEAEKAGAKVIRHPVNIGYGNALLSGIRTARYPLIAITDADGTYPVEELPSMAQETVDRDLDMLVGARTGALFHGPPLKRLARICLKAMSEFACGRKIPDINSGLRVIRRDMALRFAQMLCGGFSFTTTITIIAFITHHFVDYRPIRYDKRIGKSHVRYGRDILRTQQLLAMTVINFNPIKFFMLFAVLVLPVGVVASTLAFLAPSLAMPLLIASLFFIGSCILMGLGFQSSRENTSGYRAAYPIKDTQTLVNTTAHPVREHTVTKEVWT